MTTDEMINNIDIKKLRALAQKLYDEEDDLLEKALFDVILKLIDKGNIRLAVSCFPMDKIP